MKTMPATPKLMSVAAVFICLLAGQAFAQIPQVRRAAPQALPGPARQAQNPIPILTVATWINMAGGVAITGDSGDWVGVHDGVNGILYGLGLQPGIVAYETFKRFGSSGSGETVPLNHDLGGAWSPSSGSIPVFSSAHPANPLCGFAFRLSGADAAKYVIYYEAKVVTQHGVVTTAVCRDGRECFGLDEPSNLSSRGQIKAVKIWLGPRDPAAVAGHAHD